MADAAAELPHAGGAYVLLIFLERRLALDIPAFRGRVLEPGHYTYCGSAYGPGGIRARVSRHLRPDKSIRWHVDRLTAVAAVRHIAAYPNGLECDLVDGILAAGGNIAVRGFGSSDCKRCPAHLLSLPPGFDLSRLAILRDI